MTSIKLYHCPGSLYSQMVKLVLAEKNIEWSSQVLNLFTFENLQPSYVKLNPQGVVPTLVDGNKVICDSVEIMYYLDRKFPNPKLTPTEPELQKTMHYWIDLHQHLPMGEIIYGNYKGLNGMVLRKSIQIKEKHILQLMKTNPELKKEYADKLEKIEQLNQTIRDSQKMLQINAQIEPILDKLESQLKQSEWLGNNNYSLADVVWTATLRYLEELDCANLCSQEKRPAIGFAARRSPIDKYYQRLKSRPNFKTAMQDEVMPLPMVLAGLRRIFLGF